MAGVDMELGLDRLDGGGSTRVPLVLEGLEGMGDMEGMDHSALVQADADGRVTRNADALVLPAGSSWDASVRILAEDAAPSCPASASRSPSRTMESRRDARRRG
jgi:hypothetical protein